MKKNMGTTDRIIRLIVAAVAAVLYFTGIVTGTVALIVGIVGVIALLTGASGYCLLYLPFKLSTKKQ